MCQLKSKGGRCNGWYANQLDKIHQEFKTHVSENRQKEEVSDEEYYKKFNMLVNKQEKFVQKIREKEIIDINSSMSLEDFKRDRKRIAKSLSIYKKYDPIKYEETLNQVGAILVNRLEIKSSMSYNMFGNDPEVKDFLDKELKTGNVSVGEFEQFQRDPEKYKKYIKEIEDSPHPAIQKMVSNCKKMESLEEDKKIFKMYILEEDETEKNIEKIKNYLNSLGIKTGDPIERITNTKGKTAQESVELYKRYSDMIPTHFFDQNKQYTLNSNKRGRANVRTKNEGGLKVERISNHFTKNNVQRYLDENPKMSNTELQKLVESNTETVDLNYQLKGYPVFTLDHDSVERDSEGKIVNYQLNRLVYKAGTRKPNNKSKDVAEWELHENLSHIGYSSYNLYRKKRVVKNENIEEVTEINEINLSKDSSYNTKIHEFTHVLESNSTRIMNSQRVIYEARKEKYFKEHNTHSKGYNKDNGIFHDNLFEEEYMNKYYSHGGYEIYSMKVPEMLSGKPSKKEAKIRNAFVAMLALE